MQRWSMGHSRRPQGAHSTGSRTSALRPPHGAVSRQSVGPKTATSGVPRAAARCIGPESLVSSRRSPASTPTSSSREVWPVSTRTGPGSRAATASARLRSWAEPTSTSVAPVARCSSCPASAKRSGSQRLAPP